VLPSWGFIGVSRTLVLSAADGSAELISLGQHGFSNYDVQTMHFTPAK